MFHFKTFEVIFLENEAVFLLILDVKFKSKIL